VEFAFTIDDFPCPVKTAVNMINITWDSFKLDGLNVSIYLVDETSTIISTVIDNIDAQSESTGYISLSGNIPTGENYRLMATLLDTETWDYTVTVFPAFSANFSVQGREYIFPCGFFFSLSSLYLSLVFIFFFRF